MYPEPAPPERLDQLEALIERWLTGQVDENPAVESVELVEDGRRWFIRLRGEAKAHFSALLTLDQRTLRYESFLMPAPEENHAQLHEHLLRRNRKLYGLALTIGEEDGIFLVGQLDVRFVDEAELDRILGSLYACTEQFFGPAVRIGYASRLGG